MIAWLVGLMQIVCVLAQVTRVDQLKYPPIADFEIPQPTRLVLDNGLVLMLLEDHELPLVRASVLVHTGSRLEPAEKTGLAGLTGSVMRTGGTRKMSGDELDDYLEGKAAVIETSIGTSSGGASMSCLKKDFPEVLQILSDVLREPVFDEAKLAVAKNRVISQIARQNDDPHDILSREFNQLIYGEDSPYARIPTYDTIGSITRDDLVAWHAKYFHPNRTIMGLVGDFETSEAVSLVKKVFGDWKKGPEEQESEVPVPDQAAKGVYQIQKSDMNQSNIAVGHLGIRRDNPDYFAVAVLNQVLSGSFASRLFVNIRSVRGLAYDVSGRIGAGWDYPGVFSMSMSTKTESTAAGIESLLEEARNLTARPPTETEVQKAKDSILNSFVFTADSMEEILSQQLTYEYYGYPLDWLSRYREAIEKVTVDQVREAAAKYVKPNEFAILVVGPPTGLDKPLSTFGEVKQIDITIPGPTQPKVPEPTAEARERASALLQRALEAAGGAEAVDEVRSIDEISFVTAKMPQGNFSLRSRMIIAFPDRYAQEVTLSGATLTSVYTPEGAFVRSSGGVRSIPEEMKAEWRAKVFQNVVGLLKGRKSEGFSAWAVGRSEIDGRAIEQVRVVVENESLTIGIEDESGRLVQMAYRGRDFTGASGDVVVNLKDFRETGSLVLPYAATASFNGQPSLDVKIEKIAINIPIDEKLFARE